MPPAKHGYEASRMYGQQDCDLLVIGSGAGGLSAAVTAAWHGLKVIVAEKEPVLGGTTAWSGGWMWAPLNPLAQRAGIVEDPEAPRTYLRHVLGNNFNEAKVNAFLEAAPRMVAFFETNTALQFEGGLKIADTYGNVPGAGTGGRSVIAAPYDARELGDLVHRLRQPMRETTFMGMTIQAGPDLAAFMNVTRSPRAFIHAARRFGRHLIDLALHRRGMQLRNGIALVGRLLRSAADLGVELRTSSPAVRLLQEGGAVCGAVLRHAGGRGGGPSAARRRARGRRLSARPRAPAGHVPRRRRSTGPWPSPSATGDGLRLGEAVGRQVDTRSPPRAPGARCRSCPFPTAASAASRTSSSATSRASSACSRTGGGSATRATATTTMSRPCCAPCPPGRRSRPGWSAPAPFSAATASASRGRRRCRSGRTSGRATSRPAGRSPSWPAPAGSIPRGWSGRSRSTTGTPARARTLPSAVARRPTIAAGGDPDNRPNPCVAPIERGPFFAVKVVPGSFGTFAGLKTDANARVLDARGAPIPGLYAAGTDMASVMGGHYPAGGINLGPAMTFGYIAGRHAAGVTAYETGGRAARTEVHG